MDHCEFPYGVEPPFGVFVLDLGWLLAALELLVIIALLARRARPRKAHDTDVIAWKYAAILVFAEAAAKAELANVYKTRDNLLRAIAHLLGPDTVLGSGLASQVARLRGVGDAAKPPASAGHHAAPHPAEVAVGPVTSGPQVNIHFQGAHHGGHGEPKPAPSLDDQLAAVRTAAGVFATYWKVESTRLGELRDARDHLNTRGDLPADLEKLRAAATTTGGGGSKSRGGTSNHRGIHTA